MIPRIPGEPPRDLSRPLTEVKVLIDQNLDGQRLDVAIGHFLTWRSRNSIVGLIKGGYVILPDRPARPATRVRRGEVLRIVVPKRPAPLESVAPDDSDIRILYRDRWMVAVDKPAGLAVHPAGKRVYGTLIHYLHARYRRHGDPAHDVVPRLLHRIDRETSGLVMASLHEDLHSRVARQFENRQVTKTYLAVVHGCPEPAAGRIDLGIGSDRSSEIRLKLEARRDGSGQPALTRYRLLRRNRQFALVQLTPKTGRTHQLRVHMAAIGCPLVGDKVYGVEDSIFLKSLAGELGEEEMRRLVLPRHALHSFRIRFHHPFRGPGKKGSHGSPGEDMVLEAPLPEDMERLLE